MSKIFLIPPEVLKNLSDSPIIKAAELVLYSKLRLIILGLVKSEGREFKRNFMDAGEDRSATNGKGNDSTRLYKNGDISVLITCS